MCIAEQVEDLKSNKQGMKNSEEIDAKSVSKGAYDSTIGVVAVLFVLRFVMIRARL